VLGRWRGAGALVASGVTAFIALFLAHGFNLATAAALLSSIASLAITAILAWLIVVTSKLTGLADETVGYLGALGSNINPQGLLLAGVVIGSLGVLDDVTVTQISALWELKHANPTPTPTRTLPSWSRSPPTSDHHVTRRLARALMARRISPPPSPRQLGGATEWFLVPPVPPATDHLRERNARRGRSQHCEQDQTATSNDVRAHDNPAEESTGNPEPARSKRVNASAVPATTPSAIISPSADNPTGPIGNRPSNGLARRDNIVPAHYYTTSYEVLRITLP
jgi:hypothetical protein